MRSLGVLLAAALVGGTLASVAPASTAAGAFCSLTGMDTRTWTGAGDGTTWDDADNWDGPVPNNTPTSRDTVYVCIDDAVGGLVVMPALQGLEARVQAIDVAPDTTLRLEEGNKLFVYGDQATRPSVVRDEAALELLGSSYGGPGRTELDGVLTWRSLPTGPATLVSEPCMLTVGEGPIPGSCDLGTPGRLDVGPTGLVDVDGRGVNLFDRFVVDVAGTLRLRDQGYVAADHGTRIEVAGTGAIEIRNDGGLYEGFTRAYEEPPGPLQVVNEGTVRKWDGDGTSAITGTYAGGGTVRVDSGTLTLPDGTSRAATVAAGQQYGVGTCPAFASYGCEPETTADDPTSTLLRVPGSDDDGAKVRVREGASVLGDDIAPPVTAHASGLDASARRPAVLSFRFDSSVTGNRSWKKVQVFRQARTGQPFRKVPACNDRGRPPKPGQVACVDRRGRASSSRNVDQGDGVRDVVMVVRTRDTSRWVAR